MTKSPLLTPLVFTQNKSATHPRIGLGLGSLLTPSKTASSLVFFPATLAWTRAMPVFKRKLSGHLLAKSHRYKLAFKVISMYLGGNHCWVPLYTTCMFSNTGRKQQQTVQGQMTYNVYIPMPLMGMCLSLPIRSGKMRQNHLQQQIGNKCLIIKILK